MPSRSRSDGSSRSRIVCVLDRLDQPGTEQRHRHAPRDDVRLGRDHRLAGVRRDREEVEERVAARRRPAGTRRRRGGARPAPPATGLMPPIAGTLWQAAQLVPLNAGPRPSSVVSTSRKSSTPSRNSSNSAGVTPGSGSPGSTGARLRVGHQRGRAHARLRPRRARRRLIAIGCAGVGHDDHAAHERVAGAAQLRAFERVAPGLLGLERDGGGAAAALRDLDVHVGADDPEAVRGVVALQANLQRRPDGGLDLGRREAEALRQHVHGLRRLGPAAARSCA